MRVCRAYQTANLAAKRDFVFASGSQSVGVVAAHLDFDPSLIQIVDASGQPATSIHAVTTALEAGLQNKVDNTAGHIDYAATTLSGIEPSGKFAVARLLVKAVGSSGTARLAFVSDQASNRVTAVNTGGTRLAGEARGAALAIGATHRAAAAGVTVPPVWRVFLRHGAFQPAEGGVRGRNPGWPSAAYRHAHGHIDRRHLLLALGLRRWHDLGALLGFSHYELGKVGNRTAVTETQGVTYRT